MKRARHLLVFSAVALVLLLPIYEARGQDYIEYDVQVSEDGSALWRIIQVSDINAPIDTWTDFQQRILDIVNSASSLLQREMALDFNSMQIDTVISAESKTTEYLFLWKNFSIFQNQLISFGDVFRLENFFQKLYGDAALKMTYPSSLTVKSVSPAPSERDDRTSTLVWYRTQDFIKGKPSVVLMSGNPAESGINPGWLMYVAIGVASVVLGASIGGFLLHKRRKSNAETATVTLTPATSNIETDEAKIIKIIKSSGGTVRQSTIAEQTKFSKAKTSQLLSFLEQKGVVTRVKKGRDKIVSLNNKK